MWIYAFLTDLDFKGILLFICVALLIFDYLTYRNESNFPPGPLALPFVGNMLSIDMDKPHISLSKLAEAHGNVFSVRLGIDKWVVVSGYEMVKEALVTQAENFADRPYSSLMDRIYSKNSRKKENGLFQSNGPKWRAQRRFAMSTLRRFGMGKSSLEESLYEECRYLQEEIENENGKPFNPASLLNNAVSNIICQMVLGKRFDYSDHDFQTMLKNVSEAVVLEGSAWGQLYEAIPAVMKHLPGPHNKIFALYGDIVEFIRQEVETHKLDFDPNNPRDYIDVFIMEMEKHKGEAELQGFEESNLALCASDLFLAGTETTSTTLQWALVYLIKWPHIQEKVQEEIDRVIGQSRQPNMADRLSMPYTDAVLHEIQRMGNIVPLNGLRMAAKDTTLGGYFIPKGTSLMPSLTSVLFDKSEWETPDKFNPGHFLDANGKFVRREAFMPFSAGKRVCLGESLAKMELFLFFVSLFQKFRFSTLDGVELSTQGVVGVTHIPLPFKIHATVR